MITINNIFFVMSNKYNALSLYLYLSEDDSIFVIEYIIKINKIHKITGNGDLVDNKNTM